MWTVRGGRWVDINRSVGVCVCFVQRLEKGCHVVIRVIREQVSTSAGCDLFGWGNIALYERGE